MLNAHKKIKTMLKKLLELQQLEAKAYKAGYEAGKKLHDGNCVYVEKDKSEEFNRIASEIVEERIQSPKDEQNFYEEEFINDKNAMCEHND
jgi:hypothetical protein